MTAGPLTPARVALGLLEAAPKRAIIGALAAGRLRPVDLSAQLLISSATLYRHLPDLERFGVVAKHEVNPVPYAVEYSLTFSGLELRRLAVQIEGWLRSRIPLALDPAGQAAWKAVAALGEGWTASIMQPLVERPLSETELAKRVTGHSHYEICGRLSRLVDAAVLERVGAVGSHGKGDYALSEWGRRGVGVLAMASRWESLHIPDQSAPAGVEDGIAGMLATLPLVRLPQQLDGISEFGIREGKESLGLGDATAWIEVGGGRCTRCGLGESPSPPRAWAHGPLADWLTVIIEGRAGLLRRGGDSKFANAILNQFHEQLYSYEDWPREPSTVSAPVLVLGEAGT